MQSVYPPVCEWLLVSTCLDTKCEHWYRYGTLISVRHPTNDYRKQDYGHFIGKCDRVAGCVAQWRPRSAGEIDASGLRRPSPPGQLLYVSRANGSHPSSHGLNPRSLSSP